MFISLNALLIGALIVAVAFFVTKWLFSKDTKIEDRRRAANKLSLKLHEYGLPKIAAIIEDYGVGDYSGVLHRIRGLADLLFAGEDPLLKELDAAFERILAAKLKSAEARALIAAKLSDATVESDPKAVAVVAAAK